MECCSGAPIWHHVKKMPEQRMHESVCRRIFTMLIKAVAFMHSRKVAHRDLKLENILFDFDAMLIKIIDFGFSL